MAKKGILILQKDGVQKASYCHRFSELSGLGKQVVALCRSHTPQQLRELFDGIILVDEDTPMTNEQHMAYRKYMPEQTWVDDCTWTRTLVCTRDITQPIADGYPWMVDYSSFPPAWRCRYHYIIDLDNETLTLKKHGLEILNAETDDIDKAHMEVYPGGFVPVVLGVFSLASIPQDWIEQCEHSYRSKKLVLVDLD